MPLPKVDIDEEAERARFPVRTGKEKCALSETEGSTAVQTISINAISDGILIVGRDGTIHSANEAITALFGYEAGEVIGQKVELLVPRRYRDHQTIREDYQRHPVQRPMGKVQEVFGLHKDGREIPVDLSLRPVESDGTVICIVRDISDHVRLATEFREAAYRDVVTKTHNRRAFYEDLARILHADTPASPGTCVVIFDLDHFKDINDSLGHHCGDHLLAEFCGRLREIMHVDMRLYRIGGDEFAIIAPDCPDHSRAKTFVDTAIRLVRRPYTIEGHRVGIGCSAGIVHAPTDGTTAENLLANADLALYEAKSIRGTSSVFTPCLREAVEERFSLLSELRTAGDESEFELHFQPQVDLRSGAITGAEALLRWKHPEHGLLAPGRFIDVLADSELSVATGRWALFEACREAALWQSVADRPVHVAVNLFPWQVRTREFFDDVREALDSVGLAPHLLELELTENTIIDSSNEFIEILGAIRDEGVKVALDDFGTGYASLNSLMRFPIDTLKIDRSFVRNVGNGKGNWPVLRMIPKLARDLGLSTVAEGVETVEDAMMIQHFGYDFGQAITGASPPGPASSRR